MGERDYGDNARSVICSYERRDAKEQRASDRTAEEAGLFTEALLKSNSWGKDLSAAYQSQSSTQKRWQENISGEISMMQ